MPGFFVERRDDDGLNETPPPSRSPSNGKADLADSDDEGEKENRRRKNQIFCEKFGPYYRMTCQSLWENFQTLDVVVTHVSKIDRKFYSPRSVETLRNEENFTNTFFVILAGMKDKFDELLHAMNGDYFEENSVIFDKLSPGLPCAARYSNDDVWYRGQILANSQDGRYARVLFVDFGNLEDISYENVQPLPRKFVNLPALALRCRRTDGSQLLDDVLYQKLKMKIFGVEKTDGDPIYEVDLWPSNQNCEKNQQKSKQFRDKNQAFQHFENEMKENRSKIKQIYTKKYEDDFRQIDQETTSPKKRGGDQESYDPWWKKEKRKTTTLLVDGAIPSTKMPPPSFESKIDQAATNRKPKSKSSLSNGCEILYGKSFTRNDSAKAEFFEEQMLNVANFSPDLGNLEIRKEENFSDVKMQISDCERKFENGTFRIAKEPCETDLSLDEDETFALKKALARTKPKLGKKGKKARRARRQFLFSGSDTDEDDEQDEDEMYSYPPITSFTFSSLPNSSRILDVGKNDFLDVQITHVEMISGIFDTFSSCCLEANLFYARPDHLTSEFEIFSSKMADYYTEKATRSQMNGFRIGTVCVNLHFGPSKVIAAYRCVVSQEINKQEVDICFIDYGSYSRVFKSSLFRISREFGQKPCFCLPFIIKGVHSCKSRVNRNFVEYLLKEETLCVNLLNLNKDSTAVKVVAFDSRNENLRQKFLMYFDEDDYCDYDLQEM